MSRSLSPAERVERLRKKRGESHDRFAEAVKAIADQLGLVLRPNRQTIIRWEAGKGISPEYAEVLASLADVQPEAFRPKTPSAQFRSSQDELVQLRGDVDALRLEMRERVRRIENRLLGLPQDAEDEGSEP